MVLAMVNLLLLDSSFGFEERAFKTPCLGFKTVLTSERNDFPMGTVGGSNVLIFVPSARFEPL